MAISKVIYKSSANATPVTWMDATTATATAEDIIAPKTAMLADGVVTTGTGTGGGSWNIAAGTITPSADTRTLSLSVDFDPQYVFVLTDPYDLDQTSAWKNTVFISERVDGYSMCIISRYLNDAFGLTHGGYGQDAKASYSNGVLELSRWNYSWLSGVTYKWFCVGAKT